MGIQVPESIGDRLLRLEQVLKPRVPVKRWYGVEQFHITTNFLGELEDAGFEQAVRALKVASSHPVFSLSLEGVGVFPNARVVWGGVGGETDKLALLQKDLGEAFRPLGAEKYAKPQFIPHITLARTGDLSGVDLSGVDLGRILEDSFWLVDSACMFESVLDPAGARYPVVHKVPLVNK
ncbi:RNA 2',3'-cyclic phosphodiesterase [Effusibacillus lacus]|uniref:RNA 2',3'-cyclic phosphodiesterase n=1 Tax=Effusibacillus lacus TaxID=1348429 RepID=UPI0010DFFC65|nr:RNA 2',3'-cyclic phosphodiesterase [Effusibacillus lacus]TCS74738.1 2'-5' RNA ligase [Effusibacillus lacus]